MKHLYFHFLIFMLFGFILFSKSEKINNNCNASIIYAEKDGIDGQYIVILEDNLTDEEADEILGSLESEGVEILHQYKAVGEKKRKNGEKFHGFSIKVDENKRSETLGLAKQNCGIKYIEQDQIVKVSACNTQTNAGWCLAKIPRQSSQYIYPSIAGYGSTVYIIDTGCNWTHPDLNGRISWLVNFVSSEGYYDLNGHGTAVTSLVGGYQAGSAKSAELICVKALDKNGQGTSSTIIAALNWCANQSDYGIINMSFGSGFSTAVNSATQNAYNNGHLPVVAAGNDNVNAVNVSPASTTVALTVTSSNSNNNFASFSNYGSVIDVIVPGVLCNCAYAQTNGFTQFSGTSVSAPLAAGVAAVIQSQYGWTNNANSPYLITNTILNAAKSNQVSNVPAGTVNKLLYWYYC